MISQLVNIVKNYAKFEQQVMDNFTRKNFNNGRMIINQAFRIKLKEYIIFEYNN